MVIVLVIFIVLVQRQIKRPLPFLSAPRSAVEVPAETPAPPAAAPSKEKAEQPRTIRVSDEELQRQVPPGASIVE